jgi:hypothetical protein
MTEPTIATNDDETAKPILLTEPTQTNGDEAKPSLPTEPKTQTNGDETGRPLFTSEPVQTSSEETAKPILPTEPTQTNAGDAAKPIHPAEPPTSPVETETKPILIKEQEPPPPRRLGPLEMKDWEEFLLRFGWKRSGPHSKAQLETLAGYIVQRYSWEDALKYVDAANNRLLNKARGLITFNGLTLAAIGTLIRVEGTHAISFAAFGMVMALLSAGTLLWTHFLVDFGRELSDYENAEKEFRSYVVMIATRAKWIWITGLFRSYRYCLFCSSIFGENETVKLSCQSKSPLRHAATISAKLARPPHRGF